MKILLFGNTGQLGCELECVLSPLGDVHAFDFPHIDFAHIDSTTQIIRKYKPDVIINSAAYTAVDQAEVDVERANAVNSVASGVLAEEAKLINAALVHYSTDYVFDGRKGTAYLETDSPNPLNVYGSSKLEGERAIQDIGGGYLILRTAWVYSTRRDSFLTKVLGWARKHSQLSLVIDQVGSPTWARMLAECTGLLLAKCGSDPHAWFIERKGLYHLAGKGSASRYEFGRMVLEFDPNKDEQTVEEILPAYTVDFPTPAVRPLYTVLDCSKFEQVFGLQLPGWRTSLRLSMQS